MGDSQKQHYSFNLSCVFPSECRIRNGVLVAVKQLTVEACGCTDTCGATGWECRNKRETVTERSMAESKTKEEWRKEEEDPSSNESFMGLVTGHQSQASTPPPTHGSPTTPPLHSLCPILNNSLCSHSLPPEGFVSWRHQRDDLTAPERSRFFLFVFFSPLAASIYSSTHIHTYIQPQTHTWIIPANSLICVSCSLWSNALLCLPLNMPFSWSDKLGRAPWGHLEQGHPFTHITVRPHTHEQQTQIGMNTQRHSGTQMHTPHSQ